MAGAAGSDSSAPPQLILAFDYGARRIGVAGGDTLTRTARALKTLRWNGSLPWDALDRLIADYKPARLVVGVPYNADGTPGAVTAAAQDFARALQSRFKLPATEVDEYGSSLEAAERLKSQRQSGLRARRIKPGDIDTTAACVILERWLATL